MEPNSRREKMMYLSTLIDLFAATKKTEGRSPKTITCNEPRKLDRFSTTLTVKLGQSKCCR
jgi:hypothetical protein